MAASCRQINENMRVKNKMNYGEKLAYWYLRLNGFFLIENFVIHRTKDIDYSSDIDVMAVRFPFVYEEIGGKPDDWDQKLLKNLNPQKVTGIICEVKTGEYDERELFRSHYLNYGINRFGFIPNLSDYISQIIDESVFDIPDSNFQVAKLFVANDIPKKRKDFIYVSIPEIRDFLHHRFENYSKQKWQDRLFFQSDYLQDFIDRVKHECEKKK